MALLEKTFKVGDITLSYGEGPNNGDPMVLLHGITGWRQAWDDTVIAHYEALWHLYAIDLRGHGKSSHAADENAYHIVDFVNGEGVDLVEQCDGRKIPEQVAGRGR